MSTTVRKRRTDEPFFHPRRFFLRRFTPGCFSSPYQCRKSGSALHKHLKVYKRSQCGLCFHVITVCRLGDNGRMTYFCERCQSGDPSGLDIR